MSARNLIALFVLVLFVSATNAFADERNTKYQDVFYPDGMPVKSVEYVEGQTEYELLDELTIPNTDLIVVVFSENIKHKYIDSDTKYSIFLSILQSSNNSLRIAFLREVSDYFTLSGYPEPGYFEEVKGVLDHFNVLGYDAVHLNLFANISGNGFMREYSDIFYILIDNGFVPVLELISDGYGGRGGPGYSNQHITSAGLADIDSDGVVDVVTQMHNYEENYEKNIHVDEFADHLDVYKFDKSENKYKFYGKISSWPEDVKELRMAFVPLIPRR